MVAQTALVFIFALLALLVLWQLLTGRINLKGLFNDKVTGTFSPGRVQLLLVTLLGVGGYFLEIVEAGNATSLAEPSAMMLGAVAGSQLLYLGGKSSSIIGQLFNTFIRK